MFKKIDHVEIIPADFAKTMEFYTHILGFQVKQLIPPRPGSPFKQIAFLSLGESTLEIIDMDKPLPLTTGPEHVGYRMMAIEVDDMDAALAQLKKQGIAPSRPPMILGKSKRAEIKDPSGLSIELRQW